MRESAMSESGREGVVSGGSRNFFKGGHYET